MFDGGSIRYDVEIDSSKFDQAFDSLNKDFDSLVGKFEELEGVLDEATQKKFYALIKRAEELGDAFETSDKSIAQSTKAFEEGQKILEEMREVLGEVGDAAEDAVEPVESLGQAFLSIAGGSGLSALKSIATGATTALATLAKKGISATNFLETSQIGMAGLLGSMKEGTKALSVAANFWQNNPFNRFDVTSATKQLVQYGRTTNQLASDLEILGNVSLSTGVGIDELAYSYGRVSASGRAMTRDIEIMANKGVPIWRELTKQLNTTQQGVRELAAQGEIDFETFRKAMEGAVDSEAMAQYEHTLARQQDRLSGSISILAGDLAGYKIVNNQLEISVGSLYENWVKLINTLATSLRSSGLRDGLTKIGQVLGSALDKVMGFYQVWDEENQKWVQHSKTLETVFGAISKIVDFIGDHGALLIPIAGLALSVVGRLVAQVPILGNVFGGLGNKITGIYDVIKDLDQTKSAVAGLVSIFAVGLVSAYKNSETFRESISKLLQSLGQIVKNLLPVVQTFIQAFVDFAGNPAVTTIWELLAAVLADIVAAIAGIPKETLTVLLGVVIGLKMSAISPWLYWGTALALAYSWLKKVIEEAGGLKTVLNRIGTSVRETFVKIGNWLKSISLENIGKNFVAGFFKGTSGALADGKNGIIAGFTGVVSGIKKVLGIHSPSTVAYGIGANLILGLANGITDSTSVAQKAMDNLAKDILKIAQKVVSNKQDFGVINVNGVYKEWKKISKLFTEGSEQYASALEQMEEARKSVNLEILRLQNEYNDALDDSIKKIKSFYGIFDEVSTKGGKNATQIIKNLDKQVAQTAEWAEAQRIINTLGLDPELVEELRNLGTDSVSELSSVANMTASELETLNSLWLQKQSLAETASVEQLTDFKDDTLKQIAELKDGIDGETIDVREVGGRLVSEIGEGITGAIPTLEESFSRLGDYIAKASKGVADSYTVSDPDSWTPDTDPGADPDTETWGTDLGEALGKFALAGLGGVLLAGVAKKVLPQLGGLLQGKGGALGKLGGLFGKSTSAGQMGQSVDLSYLNSSTSSLAETGKGLAKFDKIAGSVAKGAGAVIVVALAIAAIAGAIWTVDNALKDVDWGSMVPKLVAVAAVTAVMATIAGIIGKFAGNVAIGGAVVLELAVDIAAIATALGWADLAMAGIKNWSEFGNKLGMMATAIGAFALIDGALGALGPVTAAIAIGGAVVLELAVDIAAVAAALGKMDREIPDEIQLVKEKFKFLAEAIGGMTVLTGLNGLLAPLEFLGSFSIDAQSRSIIKMSKALRTMDENIPAGYKTLQQKLQAVKAAITEMGEANFGNAFKNVVQSSRIEAIKPAIEAFGNIAGSLRQLSGLDVTSDDVLGILGAIRALVENQDTLVLYGKLGENAAKSMADGVQNGLPYLYQAGNAVQSSLWQGVQDKFADEYKQGVYLVKQVSDGAYSVVGEFQKVGNTIQSKLWWGVQNKMNDQYQQGRSMGERFRQGLYDIDYGNAGWWAVQGFINGAWGKAGSHDGLYNTGKWLAERFLKGITDRGEQGSPWQTTKRSGRWAAQGLIDGIVSMKDKVIGEAEAVTDGIIEAMDLSDVVLTPTIAPNMLAPSAYETTSGTYGGRNVVINNNVTAYTEYDISQNLKDLSWEIARV